MIYYILRWGSMNRKIEIYNKLSHKLALKQLLERFCFEIAANEDLFDGNGDVTLETLKNDCHIGEVFSDEEYNFIYKKSKEITPYKNFLDKYDDLMSLINKSVDEIDILLDDK